MKRRPNSIRTFVFPVFFALFTLSWLLVTPAGYAGSDPFGGAAIGGPGDDVVDARVVLSHESVAAGKTYTAAVVIDIDNGWHINSVMPYQDFLIPASLTIDSLDGFSVGSVEFPSGHDMTLAGDQMSVYSGEVVVPFQINIGGDVADGSYELPVRLHYQACNNQTCAPPKTEEMTLSIKVGAEGPAANTAIFRNVSNPPAEEEIAPGVYVWQMAFGNSVPGPVPVVFQWDWVDLTLVNGTTDTLRFQPGDQPSNTMAHNIDFHASTGALGGAGLTLIGPGQEVGLLWRATKAGFFVYHCAPGGPMVPYHVVSGGNGAILVLPREGLRDGFGDPIRYDRAFYFGEQDYYVPMNPDGTSKRFGSFAEQMAPMLEVMRGLKPTHIALNGKYGALTSDIRLEAEVGETVLLLHSQANNPSYPHLIGGHGDWVWPYGKFNNRPMEGLESWEVVAGGTAAAVYTFRQPGTYVYLNHNLIKAFLYDARAFIRVEGEWDDDLMTNSFEARSIGGQGPG